MTSVPLPFARPRPGTQPPTLYPDYQSTAKRARAAPRSALEHTLSETHRPVFANGWAGPDCTDLTRQHAGEPLGVRIIVTAVCSTRTGGRCPARCSNCGSATPPGATTTRSISTTHRSTRISPEAGQVVTGPDGSYRFLTIKPGAYPWRNTPNAWRPAHIHFGVFGPGFAARLVTDVFPRRPAAGLRPIYRSTADTRRASG